MKSFTDEKRRKWTVTVNTNTGKRVRDLLGVNLFDLFGSGEEAGKLFADPCLLVDVLYVICQEQAETKGISDQQFGQGLVGDSIENAANALLEAVADFFPTQKRTTYLKILKKGQQIAELLSQEADRIVDNATFFGYDAGELLLTRVSGSRREDTNTPGNFVWDISFGFAVSFNDDSIAVGDITAISKDGWDYLWIYYEEIDDDTNHVTHKRPVSAYVERVYKRTDYSVLGLS